MINKNVRYRLFSLVFFCSVSFLHLASSANPYEEESFFILPYEEAKKDLSKMRVKTAIKYYDLHRKEEWFREQFPRKPQEYYEKFTSWEDFLGVEDAMPNRTRKPLMSKGEIDGLISEIESMETSKKKPKPKNPVGDKSAKQKVSSGGNTNSNRIQRGSSSSRKKSKTKFVSYSTARERVQAAGVQTLKEYKEWQRQHPDMPSRPYKAYKNLWESWLVFLGKEPKVEFVDYSTARERVQAAGIRTSTEYKEWQRQHPDMPSDPYQTYKNLWESWLVFLGKEPTVEFVDYETARERVQAAKIRTATEYIDWQKQHPDMPSNPNRIYKGLWKNWPGFLGKKFVDYETAKKKVQEAGVRTAIEYKEWQKQHLDMPSTPQMIYKDFWKNWSGFLGKKFVDYETAKKKVQAAGIRTAKEYNEWQKQHPDMPSVPQKIYKDFWEGWFVFLGKEPKVEFIDYSTARERVQAAGVQTAKEYNKWQKKHPDMPSSPDKTYKDKGWNSWPDFLGVNHFRRGSVDYETLKKKVQAAGIQTSIENKDRQKQDLDRPTHPNPPHQNKSRKCSQSFSKVTHI